MSSISKILYFIAQIVSIPYFLNTGLFSLVLKNYPFLIVSFLTNALVGGSMFFQVRHYKLIF